MNIRLFNKKYWVRCFEDTPKIVKGYAVHTYTDELFSLNVHPTGHSSVSALPEGERVNSRLEAQGDPGITPSDIANGKKGDLLYYDHRWYECVSAVAWDHTMLSHVNYLFALVPPDASAIELANPPEENPEDYSDFELVDENNQELTDEKDRDLYYIDIRKK